MQNEGICFADDFNMRADVGIRPYKGLSIPIVGGVASTPRQNANVVESHDPPLQTVTIVFVGAGHAPP